MQHCVIVYMLTDEQDCFTMEEAEAQFGGGEELCKILKDRHNRYQGWLISELEFYEYDWWENNGGVE